MLKNGIAELVGTKETEAISFKITDSSEAGIAARNGQVAIDLISGMDDAGLPLPITQTRTLLSPPIWTLWLQPTGSLWLLLIEMSAAFSKTVYSATMTEVWVSSVGHSLTSDFRD